MGKLTTAARAAHRGNGAKHTSRTKLRNKRQQKTPKVMRKAKHRMEVRREEEMEQVVTAAQKRLDKLSFDNFKKSVKKEVSSAPLQDYFSKNAMSRSQRNQFARQNKKVEKQQLPKTAGAADKFDFSSYDREIEQDADSSDEDDDMQQQRRPRKKQRLLPAVDEAEPEAEESLLQKCEMEHEPRTWDVRKSKLAYLSSSGDWIHDNERVDEHYIEREDSGGEEQVIVDETQIADYLNLGAKMQMQSPADSADSHDDDDDNVNDDDEDEDEGDVDMPQATGQRKLTPTQWKLRKKARMTRLKLELADMAENVMQDPYQNCALLPLISALCSDADIEVCQLAMLSFTRLVIDIMPPYKIGTIQQSVSLKRQNEKVRQFEKTLLTTYQSFLKQLFKLAQIYHSNTRGRTKRKEVKRFILARCAVKCVFLFIRQCSHFNYTKELIKNTIPLTNCDVHVVREEACHAMTFLLSQPINNVTVECVQLLTQRIEKKNFNVHWEQIAIFQNLPLQYLEAPQQDVTDEREKPIKSKWEKKLDKKLKREDQEQRAGVDKRKQYMRQKVIIEAVFGVFFYILKLPVSPQLLEPALQGLSKFAHLINVELVLDLIAVISDKLATEANTLSLPCKLLCINTTFKVLSGRGTAIEMDVRQHYETIYNALLSVALNQYEWPQFELVFECLHSMFGHRASKTVPVDRVAAFVQRLVSVSTQIPPCYAVACQHMARKLLLYDPRLYNMLDFEGGNDREHQAFERNPDHVNALSCCLWELSLTSYHFHPFLKQYSRDLSTWSEIPMALSTTAPDKLLHRYDTHTSGEFRPFVAESKLQKFSMVKHAPKELDNAQAMKEMAQWFEVGYGKKNTRKRSRKQDKLKRIAQAIVHGNGVHKMAEKTIAGFAKHGHLLAQNKILKELNDEYKLLSKLLQSD